MNCQVAEIRIDHLGFNKFLTNLSQSIDVFCLCTSANSLIDIVTTPCKQKMYYMAGHAVSAINIVLVENNHAVQIQSRQAPQARPFIKDAAVIEHDPISGKRVFKLFSCNRCMATD